MGSGLKGYAASCGTIAPMSATPSTSLTVSVPAHVDAFIKDRVAAGRFETAGDVVGAAIPLLVERERMGESVLDEIRRDIEVGVAQVEAGQVRDGEEVFREIPARRSRNAQRS